MKLAPNQIDPFLALLERPGWRPLLSEESLWKCRVVVRDDDLVAGALISENPEGWFLQRVAGESRAMAELYADVVELADAKGVDSVHVRYQKEECDDEIRNVLTSHRFVQTEERIRFRRRFEEGFAEGEGGLLWEDIETAGFDRAVEMMNRVAVGDPGHDPEERAEVALPNLLADSVLTNGPETVQIGYDGPEPVAFVCAQVNRRTGWGRITYIGVIPERRDKGLGREVHRHGLAMLVAQGCRLYEGGTDVANRPMQRLFLANGCERFGHEIGYTRVREQSQKNLTGDMQ